MLRIGIDIGGTFTDFAIWQDGAGGYTSVTVMKEPSTPPDSTMRKIRLPRSGASLTPFAADISLTVMMITTPWSTISNAMQSA